MSLYHEEKHYLSQFRDRLKANEPVTYQEMIEMTDKLEEMMEVNAVTIKIIDKLMMNYNKLKQEIVQKHAP